MTTDAGTVASVVSDEESCTVSGCDRSPVRVTVAVVPSPSMTDELASDRARPDGTTRSSSCSTVKRRLRLDLRVMGCRRRKKESREAMRYSGGGANAGGD